MIGYTMQLGDGQPDAHRQDLDYVARDDNEGEDDNDYDGEDDAEPQQG